MSDMKCPFCQQELVYDSGIEQWCCDKCHLSGGYKLWQALDQAIYRLKLIKTQYYNWTPDRDYQMIAQASNGLARINEIINKRNNNERYESRNIIRKLSGTI